MDHQIGRSGSESPGSENQETQEAVGTPLRVERLPSMYNQPWVQFQAPQEENKTQTHIPRLKVKTRVQSDRVPPPGRLGTSWAAGRICVRLQHQNQIQ